MMSIKDLLLAYMDIYDDYHSAKENMAYGATTLYLVAASALVTAEHPFWENYIGLDRAGLVLLVLVTTALAFVYVNQQFRLRFKAANMYAACNNYAVDLLTKQPPAAAGGAPAAAGGAPAAGAALAAFDPQQLVAKVGVLFKDQTLPEGLAAEYERVTRQNSRWNKIWPHRLLSSTVIALWFMVVLYRMVVVWSLPSGTVLSAAFGAVLLAVFAAFLD
jgi:hypothetical protein